MLRRRLPSLGHALTVLSLAVLFSALTGALPANAQTTSGTLLGGVRDKTGKAVTETKITLENEENGNLRATRVDDSGNYAFFNLPPGTYKITATRQGFRDQAIKGFPVQFNQKNVVKLPLFTLLTATLRGTVVDPAGNPVSGARVFVVGESDHVMHETVTRQDGGYIIPDLPLGNYALTALWADSRRELIGTSPIPLSEQTMDLKFVAVLGPRDSPGNRRPSPTTQSLDRGRTTSIQTAQFRRVSFTAEPALRKVVPAVRGPVTVSPHPAAGQPSKPATQNTSSAVQTYQDGSNASSLVNTTDAARSRNFSERQINALPIGGANPMRSFDELALLVPGVAPPPYTPGVRGPGVGFGIGTAGQFSVNGMRARSNNFSVDGSDNNDPDVGVRRQGFVALVPQSLESVKEISISTLLWDAELGRNFGGQINAVSKYGGNQFHGQLYGLLSDSRLNAKNFFDTNGKPPFTRTQAGLTIGGPIVRNRTHFFFSFEHDQTRAATTQHFSTPMLSERSLARGAPFFAHTPDPDNRSVSISIGPFTDFTPLGGNILSLYPAPNNPAGPHGANTFTQVLPADGTGDIFSFRLTHQITPDNSLNARYNFTNDRRILPSVNGAIRSTLDSRTRSHNVSLIFDSALSPKVFNQARFSFGRTRLNFLEYPGSPFIFSASSNEGVSAFGGPPRPRLSMTGPIGELRIEPYSPVGVDVFTFPQRRASNTFQYADSISWMTGKHSIKFGGDIRRYQLNSVSERLYRPQVVYAGGLFDFTVGNGHQFSPMSGVQLASLGAASSVFQTITSGPPNSAIGLRLTEYHFFINDNWKVHPRLSMDFGLRYDLSTVPREANNRIENALRLENLPTAGGSPGDGPSFTFQFNEAVNAYRRIVDGRERIYDPDRNNFGPHAGLAWALDAESKITLRAGYGVYYDTVLGAVVSQSRNVFPNEIPINVDPTFLSYDLLNLNNPVFLKLLRSATNNLITPINLIAQRTCNQFGTCNQLGGAPEDFVALVGALFLLNTNGGLAFTLPEKKLRTPYAQQWHLTLERDILDDYFLSVAYAGTRGTKLIRLTTPNLGPNVTPQIPSSDSPGTGGVLRVSTERTHAGFIFLPPLPPCVRGPLDCRSLDDRPNTFLGPYQIFESSANSSYHALQLEARNRYNRNVQFTAAYTWSHAIDDVSDVFPIAGAPVIAQDSSNLRAERASANFDIRHRFAASLLWDSPFFRNSRGVAGYLLGKWQVASIFQAHTGQPFTLNVPFDANLDGNLTDRPSTTDGLVFFNGHGPQRVAMAPGRSYTDFFALAKNGVVGRNTVRGDSFINLDLAIGKKFQFTETRDLIFRAEFFNLLNRANFGLPVRVIGAPGFGSAVETAVPARTVVLVVKSRFD